MRQPLDLEVLTTPKGHVYVISSRCKGCKFCVEFCPKDVLEESPGINAKGYHYPAVVLGKEHDCIHCEFCSVVCPELAIYTTEDSKAA
ncbi:MAG: 4Fe-4S dicluster domain-containing protein [Elusimicrobiota bacterium]|mgnify:CR=1 FL=1